MNAQPSDRQNAVIVYSTGLVACSVCALRELTLDEVERTTNLLNPTGVGSQWRVSPDPTFHGGGEQPGPCDQEPGERIHYLMEC